MPIHMKVLSQMRAHLPETLLNNNNQEFLAKNKIIIEEVLLQEL